LGLLGEFPLTLTGLNGLEAQTLLQKKLKKFVR
jgi:hypothetical protein